jgi:hypothetical protein
MDAKEAAINDLKEMMETAPTPAIRLQLANSRERVHSEADVDIGDLK